MSVLSFDDVHRRKRSLSLRDPYPMYKGYDRNCFPSGSVGSFRETYLESKEGGTVSVSLPVHDTIDGAFTPRHRQTWSHLRTTTQKTDDLSVLLSPYVNPPLPASYQILSPRFYTRLLPDERDYFDSAQWPRFRTWWTDSRDETDERSQRTDT